MTKSRLPSTGRATGDGDFDVGGAGADPCNGETGGGVPAAPFGGGPGGMVEPGGAGATLPPGTVQGDGIPLCCPDTALGLIVVPGWPLPTATPPNGSPGPALTSGSAGAVSRRESGSACPTRPPRTMGCFASRAVQAS